MRQDIAETLRERDFEPVIIAVPNGSTDQFVSAVLAQARMAVCDQRLAGMTGKTQGAEIVAALTKRKVPAILYSQKKSEDVPELRRYFDLIPRFVDRDELSTADLFATFASITRELDEGVSKERRLYRTLVRVEERFGPHRASIVIPAWRLDESLEISTEDVGIELRDRLVPGARLFGQVNLHALRAEDIFVRNFEAAEPPDQDDGFA
jgi:hypothetical protein